MTKEITMKVKCADKDAERALASFERWFQRTKISLWMRDDPVVKEAK